MSRTKHIFIFIAGLFLVLVKLLYDLYLASSDGGLTPNIANDALQWAWPYYNYASASIRSGVLPLWNPYSALGSPFFADISVGMFYPINWINLLVEVPIALVVVQFLTVAIAMANMYCYTRYLQFTSPARFLCVALFAYTVFTESFHPVMGSSLCWLPALLWLTHRFFDSPVIINALFIGVVLALCFLAGFPNFFLYTCMILFVYGTVILLGNCTQTGFSGLVSRVVRIIPALLLALGLISVQLLPAYELSTYSVRAIDAGSAHYADSLFEQFSLALMISNYFQADLAYVYALESMQINSGLYYLGGALLLLPFSFASRKYRVVSIALACSFVFLTLFMMSHQVSALAFLQQLPLADSLRIHGRAIAYTQSLLIVLLGMGFSALHESVRHSRGAGLARTLLGVMFFMAYAILAMKFAFDIPDNYGSVIGFAVSAALIVFLLVLRTESAWVSRCFWILTIVIILDVSFHRGNRFLVPAFAKEEHVLVNSNLNQVKSSSDDFRVFFAPRYEGAAYKLANVGLKYQFPNISAYSPMVMARWENFIRNLAGESEYDLVMSRSLNKRFYGTLTPSLQQLLSNDSKVLDMSSVRYIYSGSKPKLNENAFPRAYSVRQYIQTKDETESLAAIKANLGLLENTVVLEGSSPSFSSVAQPSSADQGTVVVVLHTPNQVDLDVDVSGASIVVLTDAFYPGWSAYVDDESVPIYRANSVFRAVEVPPGKHRVSFRFQSGSLFLGAVITLFSLGTIVALVLAEGARRRRYRTSSFS